MGAGTLILITGASKGIGQACAIAFARNAALPPPVRLCIIARSQDGLEKTAKLVQQAAAEVAVVKSRKEEQAVVEVVQHVVDLSDLDALEDRMLTIFQEIKSSISRSCNEGINTKDGHRDDGSSNYDRTILINNAGSLGHLGPSTDMVSLLDLRKVIDLNVTSSMWLSSNFVRQFGNPKMTTKCTVVNISSLCAIQPFETMATYCSGKAARDMFHAVMAKEVSEKSNSSCSNKNSSGGSPNCVKILNYAPGAVDTEMTVELSQSSELDDGLSSYFNELPRVGDGRMLTPNDTASKLVDLLIDNNFQSGAHVDYWDLIDKVK